MKKLQITFSVLFFTLLLAAGAAALFGPQKTFSEEENRTLRTRGDLSFSFNGGEFAEDAERMLCEQFPWRAQAVKARTAAAVLSGRRDVGGAYVGSGRLFLKLTDAEADLAGLRRTSEKFARLGEQFPDLPVYVLGVPDAGVQLGDLLPAYAPMYDPQPFYDAFASVPGCTAVDLRPVLTDPADYYLTDHHWTLQGAYKAYALWKQAKGEAAPECGAFSPRAVTDAFYGTLSSKAPGAKAGPDTVSLVAVPDGLTVTADGKEIAVYDFSALETKDKYRVFFGGNHGIVAIENPAAPGGSLLVVKDSFANCFVPFLLGDYARVVLVDDRYAAVSLPELVKTYGATEVLYLKEIFSLTS